MAAFRAVLKRLRDEGKGLLPDDALEAWRLKTQGKQTYGQIAIRLCRVWEGDNHQSRVRRAKRAVKDVQEFLNTARGAEFQKQDWFTVRLEGSQGFLPLKK